MSDTQSADRWVKDHVRGEFSKSYERRVRDGFMARYLSGNAILDIGYRGGSADAVPVTETAIGVDRDYPGYDGIRLPFEDASQDAVVASHVLEHIPDFRPVLAEWFRVLKIGGYLVVIVPHKYLFEKRPEIPSRRAGDHCRFYTPASLLAEIEQSLPVNGFRIRHLVENDHDYNYDDDVNTRPIGCFEIELVAERIVRPPWSDELEYSPVLRSMIQKVDQLIFDLVAAALKGTPCTDLITTVIGKFCYFTPWQRLREHFVFTDAPELGGSRVTEAELRAVVRPMLDLVDVDVASYVEIHPDIGRTGDPPGHWRVHGYFEGRATRGTRPGGL